MSVTSLSGGSGGGEADRQKNIETVPGAEEGTVTDVLSREYSTHGRKSSHELDSPLPAALG